MSARCSEHVGEPYPPRCSACDLAEVEAAADFLAARLTDDAEATR